MSCEMLKEVNRGFGKSCRLASPHFWADALPSGHFGGVGDPLRASFAGCPLKGYGQGALSLPEPVDLSEDIY